MTDEEAAFAANEELVRAYRLCFGSPAGQTVMQDLVNFCRAATTTYGNKTWSPELLEGRRQVFLRVQNAMNLTPEELLMLRRSSFIRLGGNE